AAVGTAPVLDDRYPPAKVMFGSDVESHPDLIYSTLPGYRPMRLDLYRQTAGANPRPLVVYVHGGGWQSGHTRHSGAFENWPEVLASLARRGYVVASLEYRLSGEAKFPAAIHDVKNAIKWLRASAARFAIDPQRVVIWGGSAGGQLAALAATSCGVQELAPPTSQTAPEAQSDCVQGLVAWYGVFEIAPTPALASNAGEVTSPIGKYLGCVPGKCVDIAALASPVTHADPKDPPALLIHGELDRVVPVSQSREFDRVLKGKGVASDLIVIPAVDHSFVGTSPEATRKASLLALTKTFEFIDSLRGGKAQ
ncbi:MAG TPA: alpha/beta hydrolase, partial [Nitrospiraceae bacterium]|nr:alpha/beta hydrolase [Nitrospiraceae bacterium]